MGIVRVATCPLSKTREKQKTEFRSRPIVLHHHMTHNFYHRNDYFLARVCLCLFLSA
ncbi:hypothetical protein Q31a_08280 [Aureliella helgolandensis]|uniref:Uncharacterized protein n=1 Tax=Aureliella helgolandensis TaxID=2527968 RepID=A0A518G1S2_9BACT|nr:hypothetical protein Q31a_08280 [Aureliella helgolandensis]